LCTRSTRFPLYRTAKSKVGLRIIDWRIVRPTGFDGRSGLDTLEGFTRFDSRTLHLVSDGHGMDIESSDAYSLELFGLFAIKNGEPQVIVEKVLVFFVPGVTGGSFEPDGITTNGIVELLAAHQHGELIKRQMNAVLTLNEFA
jgi:hypothetical protein